MDFEEERQLKVIIHLVLFYFAMSLPIGLENLVTTIGNIIKIRKMKAPLHIRHDVIKYFRIPPKIRIGNWSEVSAVYKGSVKSGYFSLMIQDCDGVKQWFKDNSSVDHKLLNSGERVQTGKLNFSNGLYESKWKFRLTHLYMQDTPRLSSPCLKTQTLYH